MEEIKVGEYVRTSDGKIIKFLKFGTLRKPCSKEIIGKTIIAEKGHGHYKYENIVKHSSNIIDLIEVGDYVNGHKVVNEIWGEDDNNLYFEIEGGFNKAQYIGEKNIKSICTREQFENAEYKLDN